MKKILFFIFSTLICATYATAAVRDENATNRQTSVTERGTNTVANVTARTATTSRTNNSNLSTRNATNTIPAGTGRTAIRTTTQRQNLATKTNATNASRSASTTVSRSAITPKTNNVTSRPQTQNVSRAAIDKTADVITETRTGAAYEQCKNAYFTCMDQFCSLKNDDYRRCSCSNRVFELTEVRNVMQDAGNQLTEFTENLDVVGMTAAQALAMKTASEGENALTSDTSASKALLQAIMNSIRGEDTFVGGKYSDLNSINLSFDAVNAFGTADSGQIIATYNGQNLYNAVYPQCRQAVKSDCTDAQLQRAITAYLMAIEQDCNTVESAIEQQQKEMKSAVRESSALLDLARVENRQKHNSDDITTCVNNVEAAILSEEVCGAGYHKCLDNGEFIDVSTGKPIAGVEKFYELGNLLKFADGVDAAQQKLSKVTSNKSFVQNFEKRVKKFAEPALDKCTEQADVVWEEYLDKALLAIYYAQKSKVEEIKQGCFDFVSACYVNSDAALTDAMKELTGDDSSILLQPDKVTLTTEICRDYIDSCNMMFYENSGDIIADYINNRKDTDTLTACRAVVKQCFDSFGGSNYENLYYPYSGVFKKGQALQWFTLYEYDENGNRDTSKPVSECAKQLQSIDSCSSPEMMEKAFGGFDVITAGKGKHQNESVFYLLTDEDTDITTTFRRYGLLATEESDVTVAPNTVRQKRVLSHHTPRSTGVATEIYNQVVDILSTQCINLQGRFVELQFIKDGLYKEDELCVATFENSTEYGGSNGMPDLTDIYSIGENENMCPRDYDLNVDTQSWGACLCWENGGRRSKYGQSPKCVSALPIAPKQTTSASDANDQNCDTLALTNNYEPWTSTTTQPTTKQWCTKPVSSQNQVCPFNGIANADGQCETIDQQTGTSTVLTNLPEGLGI